ncbi:hypothetical protein LTR53_013578 [Teratosphaeriaceae sp. CCFEE 6253]|nr:hypothetical protein LTR53_013578 [Teratosphaeriaceae sp. CCFEE 6253]
MAHATVIAELAGDLAASVTGISRDDTTSRSLKDATVKGLRGSHYGRTSPFEVDEHYSGLVEKFGIRNRDDLAEVLQSCLVSLPKTRWTPEILSLLLLLSDRPLDSRHSEGPDDLTRAVSPSAEPTWSEIVADDPFTDEDIWEEVERGYHSSGDDVARDDSDLEPTISTPATSLAEDDFAALARLHITQPNAQALEEVFKTTQTLYTDGSRLELQGLPELTVIREVLAMLNGLPTLIFRVDDSTGAITIEKTVAVTTVSPPVLHDVLTHCAGIGSRLNYLRIWTSQETSEAWSQSIHAAIQHHMTLLGAQFGAIERRFLQPHEDVVVSLVKVRSEVEAIARPILHLADVLATEQATQSTSPFATLDVFYGEACLADFAGDAQLRAVMASVMLAGLRTYMRPVLTWIDSGVVSVSNDGHFFVREPYPDCDLGDVWDHRFELRLLTGGAPSAPAVIQPFVQELYAVGKSKTLLKLLGQHVEVQPTTRANTFRELDASTIEKKLAANTLLSFEELLQECLRDSLASSLTHGAPSLSKILMHDGGILRTMSALEYVFFAKDCNPLQAFTELLFSRLRRDPKDWRDRFLLTRLAQDTLGTAQPVAAHCLEISFCGRSEVIDSVPVVRQLEQLTLDYAINWPMQNIIRSKRLLTHSAVFSFLLQLEYCLYLLRGQIFDIRKLESGSRYLGAPVRTALRLRTHLIWFLDILRAHIAGTAHLLQTELRVQLSEADGIHAMAQIWQKYDKRLQLCLLLAPSLAPFRDAVSEVLQLCERLADAWPALLGDGSSAGMVTGMTTEFDKGSIATGKSTVSSLLASPPYNLPVVDADKIARQVVEPGTHGYNQIVSHFGPSTPDLLVEASPANGGKRGHNGKGRPLNRPALGRRVFGEGKDSDRKALNKIVHPAVRREMYKQMISAYLHGAWAVVLDVPLLFESGWEPMCGTIMVVAVTDPAIQMQRLRARDAHLTEEDAKNRVAAQWDVRDKAERCLRRGEGAGVVVWNDGEKEDLKREVDRVMDVVKRGHPPWWAWMLLLCPPLAAMSGCWSYVRSWWIKRQWEREKQQEKAKL